MHPYFKKVLFGLILLFSCQIVFAAVVLHGNQIITTPTNYNNVTLDLTDGRFTINTGGSLSIQNSTIDITISPTNPFLTQLNNGSLQLKNNVINVKVSGITSNPDSLALYQLIGVQKGSLEITGNQFDIDTAFTVGLFKTDNQLTSAFKINNNEIKNFHGGVYLTNSDSAEVNGNTFSNVSNANVFYSGNLSKIKDNIMSFPGNLHAGLGISIENATSITIANNIIASSSSYGIAIKGGNNVFIDNNKITDGKSYAVNILTPTSLTKNKTMKLIANDNIVITDNYFSQNKYGLTGGVINQLIVNNNIFIQKFSDTSIRQYWTNNDNLLPNVAELTWADNIYKEAFTQVNGDDNTPALHFVVFPKQGGVIIN